MVTLSIGIIVALLLHILYNYYKDIDKPREERDKCDHKWDQLHVMGYIDRPLAKQCKKCSDVQIQYIGRFKVKR